MAWQEIERLTATRQTDPVSIGVSDRWGAQLSIRQIAIDQLKWATPQALRLYVDMDAGKIKVEASEAGQFRAGALHKGGALVRLGPIVGVRTDKIRNMPARYVIEGGALIVDLPAILRIGAKPPVAAAEVATARPAASIMSGPPPQRPVTGKIDVTNKFFADPKKPPAMARGVRGGRT